MIEDLGRQPQMPCEDDDGTVPTARAKGKPSEEKCGSSWRMPASLASYHFGRVVGNWGTGLVRRWSVAALVGGLAPAG